MNDEDVKVFAGLCMKNHMFTILEADESSQPELYKLRTKILNSPTMFVFEVMNSYSRAIKELKKYV